MQFFLLTFFFGCCSKQKELDTEKEMDRESSIKELQAKKNEVSLLENKVKELEQKLQLGDAARLKEKVYFVSSLLCLCYICFSFSNNFLRFC